MIYHHPEDMCTNIPWGMHFPRVWGVSQCSVWSFWLTVTPGLTLFVQSLHTLLGHTKWLSSDGIRSAEGWSCQHTLGILTLCHLWRKQLLTTEVCVDESKGSQKTNGNMCVLGNQKNVFCALHLSYANLPNIILFSLGFREFPDTILAALAGSNPRFWSWGGHFPWIFSLLLPRKPETLLSPQFPATAPVPGTTADGEPLLAGVEQTAQQHWFWTIRNGTFLFFGFVPVPHWLLFRGRGSSVIAKAQLLCCVFSFLCPLSWPCEQQKGILHQLVFSNKVFVTSGLVVGWALEAIFTPQVMAFQIKWCYITLLNKSKHWLMQLMWHWRKQRYNCRQHQKWLCKTD